MRFVGRTRADARHMTVAARVVVAARALVAEDAPGLVDGLHLLLVAAAVWVVASREPLVAALYLRARLFAPRAEGRVVVSLAPRFSHHVKRRPARFSKSHPIVNRPPPAVHNFARRRARLPKSPTRGRRCKLSRKG